MSQFTDIPILVVDLRHVTFILFLYSKDSDCIDLPQGEGKCYYDLTMCMGTTDDKGS